MVLARDEHGTVKCFPTAENSHRKGILDVSIVPAAPACLRDNAAEYARAHRRKARLHPARLGVEFFVSRGQLYRNEMAPRPHNSGHYTVDACITSQYEQQVRALCACRWATRGALGCGDGEHPRRPLVRF